jgi:hypothetical protein
MIPTIGIGNDTQYQVRMLGEVSKPMRDEYPRFPINSSAKALKDLCTKGVRANASRGVCRGMCTDPTQPVDPRPQKVHHSKLTERCRKAHA